MLADTLLPEAYKVEGVLGVVSSASPPVRERVGEAGQPRDAPVSAWSTDPSQVGGHTLVVAAVGIAGSFASPGRS
jgi:hypothetical protein